MFKFKKFSVSQEKCAMKIGTDAVLLGAWTPIDNTPYSILDIGTGTGILALMMAQRTHAEQIDAVEIDDKAHEQAVENFENSPWSDRLFCYHADLETFAHEIEDQYDLIISNPPFYTEDYKTQDSQRDLARFEDSLPFELLIEVAEHFLSEKGILSVIIPAKEENRFIEIASNYDLYPLKVTRVRGNSEAEIKRSLIALSRKIIPRIPLDELTLEHQRHQYTEKYQELVKEFYLKL